MDFDGLVAQTEAVRRQNEARVARRTAFAQQRLKEIHTEVTGQWLHGCDVSHVHSMGSVLV